MFYYDYMTVVLSKVEYAALKWYLIYDSESLQADRIHRKSLKLLSYKLKGVYPPGGLLSAYLLARLDMLSLTSREDRLCLNFLNNLLNNTTDFFVVKRHNF